jgi:hypothetical protein
MKVFGAAVVLVAWVAVVACDDTSPSNGDEQAGAAGSGDAGEGSGGSESAPGGAPGGAGVSGEGGIGGVSSEGGIGGEGGGAPAPFEIQDCQGQPLTLDEDWVRYCVLLASCDGEGNPRADLGWCLTAPRPDYVYSLETVGGKLEYLSREPNPDRFAFQACQKSIANCDDVLACAGSRRVLDECATDTSARCDGDRAVNCPPVSGLANRPGVRDCAVLTGKADSCQVIGSGETAYAACVVQASCATPGEQSCDGDIAVRCDADGIGEGEDCSQRGLTCRVSEGRAFCAPPLPTATCAPVAKARCEGNAPAYCSPDGLDFVAEACPDEQICAVIDEDFDYQHFGCKPKDCADEEAIDHSSACDGDDIVLDLSFWSGRVHCPRYGFSTCRDAQCVD